MELNQQWRRAAAQVNEIIFTPFGLGKLDEPYGYVEEIRTVAAALDPLSPVDAAKARDEADRLITLVDQWTHIWWPTDL